MSCLVCLLEEPSAQEMLEGVLPRLLPKGWYVRYIPFEGKQDLEKQLERRLRLWQTPDSIFLVMRDQDAGNCVVMLYKLTQDQYQKVAGSRAIGHHLRLDEGNKSHSFNVLVSGIRNLTGGEEE